MRFCPVSLEHTGCTGVFVAVRGLLFCGAQATGHAGSSSGGYKRSCPTAHGLWLFDQGLNLCPLRWKAQFFLRLILYFICLWRAGSVLLCTGFL